MDALTDLFGGWLILIEMAVAAGVAYGVLKVKTSATARKLDELEKEGLELDSAMRTRVESLTTEFRDYKDSTTDRLARIETKLDILLSQR